MTGSMTEEAMTAQLKVLADVLAGIGVIDNGTWVSFTENDARTILAAMPEWELVRKTLIPEWFEALRDCRAERSAAEAQVAALREALVEARKWARGGSQNGIDAALADIAAAAAEHDRKVLEPWRTALNIAAREAHATGLLKHHGDPKNGWQERPFEDCDDAECRDYRALLSAPEEK